MFKCGVFCGPYFPTFGLNTRNYGLEKTPYLDTFHAVIDVQIEKLPFFYQYTKLKSKKSHIISVILFNHCQMLNRENCLVFVSRHPRFSINLIAFSGKRSNFLGNFADVGESL